MDTNELMVNDEVIETTEEMMSSGIPTGAKIAIGIGLAAIIGYGLYRGGRFIHAKIKARQEAEEIIVIEGEIIDD